MNRTLISLLFDTLQSPAYSAVKGQEVHTFNTIHIKYYTLGFYSIFKLCGLPHNA